MKTRARAWHAFIRGARKEDWPIIIAAHEGNTEDMLLLYHARRRAGKRRWPMHRRFLEVPVLKGHDATALAAHENGAPWPPGITAWAAGWGQTNCMINLVQAGAFWSLDTAAKAARNGHTNTMIAAVEHGCPWGLAVTEQAAVSGHTDTMLAAVARGSGWSFLTVLMACEKGFTETALAALRGGAHMSMGSLRSSIVHGHLDTFRAVAEAGYTWDPWVFGMSFGTSIMFMRYTDIESLLFCWRVNRSAHTRKRLRASLLIAIVIRWWISCTEHGRLFDVAFTKVARQVITHQPRTVLLDVIRNPLLSNHTTDRLREQRRH